MAKGEGGYPGGGGLGKEEQETCPRKGAQGRRVSGDGDPGKEMAQRMLSRAVGGWWRRLLGG